MNRLTTNTSEGSASDEVLGGSGRSVAAAGRDHQRTVDR